MFHMVSTDQSIQVLCLGGKVIIIPGYDADRILHAVETEHLWWLVVMPGMIEDLIATARRRRTVPRGIKLIGAMADLVPRSQLAEITSFRPVRQHVRRHGDRTATCVGGTTCYRGGAGSFVENAEQQLRVSSGRRG